VAIALGIEASSVSGRNVSDACLFVVGTIGILLTLRQVVVQFRGFRAEELPVERDVSRDWREDSGD
jgi:hypothetical protein